MKKSTKMGQRIEIRPAKIKGKPMGFRVVTIDKNENELSKSKVLTTPANVRKNIVALFNVTFDARWSSDNKKIKEDWYKQCIETPIIDLTGKVIKPVEK